MILFGKREIEICAKPATKRGNCRKTNRVTYAAIKRDCPRALQPQRFGGLSKLVPKKVPDIGAAIANSRSGPFCGHCGHDPFERSFSGADKRLLSCPHLFPHSFHGNKQRAGAIGGLADGACFVIGYRLSIRRGVLL